MAYEVPNESETILMGLSLNYDSMYVSNGGTARDTTILSSGCVFVSEGGIASNTVVESAGAMYVSNGGTADDTTVCDKGSLIVFSGAKITSAEIRNGGRIGGEFDCCGISFESGAVVDFGVFNCEDGNEVAIVRNLSAVSDELSYLITIAQDQKTGTYKLADGLTSFDHTVFVHTADMQFGCIVPEETVTINGESYTLRLNDGDLTLTVEDIISTPQYVYLDFDGENGLRYCNSDLNLNFGISVQNPSLSMERRQAILSALTEQYSKDGIEFTLERPDGIEYSSLFFGTTDAFDSYGDFFGVSEAYDANNQIKGDNAFILLNSSYSNGQIVSVASHMLDNLLGYSRWMADTPELKDYAETKYLLTTEWNQYSPYNNYCPIDPKTKKRCVTGCTNTASSQIINYWIEKGLLDFSLTLLDSDTYTKKNITIDSSNNPRDGYLSFAEVNKILADYKPGDDNSIAALCFAVGVVSQAGYSSDGTGTPWKEDLFYRSGFEAGIVRKYYTADGEYWPKDAESYQGEGATLSEDDPIIRDLLQGRPIGTIIRNGNWDDPDGHSIVIDGYDSSTNKFHLNYGWGGFENGWYSMKEMNEREVYWFFAGVYPKTAPNLEVKKLTFDENIVSREEDISMHVSVFNAGSEKSAATTVSVSCGDTFLNAINLDFISPGQSRDLDFTVSAAPLGTGENTITVKVYSQKNDGEVSSTSQTVRVFDTDAISADDNTWQLVAAGGERTQITAEYDADGILAETVLAKGEYIGVRDLVDFRELTLVHPGKYTFSLNGLFTGDLALAIYSLTAQNSLKLLKNITIPAQKNTVAFSNVPLEKGTYYISVKAVNANVPGDSEYSLTVSGNGNLKVGNSDDWTDLADAGAEGTVLSAGVINDETVEIITDEWVGLGDEFDYRLFQLSYPAKVSFRVTATDSVKFTVYEIKDKVAKNGSVTYSLKSLQSTIFNAGKTESTKGLLLSGGNTPGKYCFSVQSMNAAKGGSADYSVSFDHSVGEFYSKGDNSDDWSDLASEGAGGAVGDAVAIADGDAELFDGWVGFCDEIDYRAISVASGAKLSFCLGATDATKFTVWKLVPKKGKNDAVTYSLKSVQGTNLSKDKKTKTFAATTKTILLEAGTYYVSMASTNAAKGGSADYAVKLNGSNSVFYVDGDNGDNNGPLLVTENKKKVPSWKIATFQDAPIIEQEKQNVQFDANEIVAEGAPAVEGGWKNFVGFGDDSDCVKLSASQPVELSFTINATGNVKLIVYSLSLNAKGQWVQKALQTTVLSLKKNQTTGEASSKKTLLLDRLVDTTDKDADGVTGYYVSVQCSNATKGGSAYYNVTAKAYLYSDADESIVNETGNGWLYDKKTGNVNSEANLNLAENMDIANGDAVKVDKGDVNFVGFGDEYDYAAFTVAADGKYSFTLETTGAAKFTVYSLTPAKNNKQTQKSLLTQTLKTATTGDGVTTKEIALTADVTYYVLIQSTGAKKGDEVYYSITANLSGAQLSAALDMPADALFSDQTNDAFGDIAAYDVGSRLIDDRQSSQSTTMLA